MRDIKTILVTGGSGFIGGNFCNLILSNTDYHIINIDNLTYASKDKVYYIQNKKNYKFFKTNICNELSIKEIFNQYKIDAVVHFAAETHVDNSIQQSDQFIKTNILGTHNLIKICKDQISQNKLTKDFVFVHISTDEVFGHLNKKDPPFTEQTKYNPRNPYSASKAAADHLVRSFISTYDFPAVILNCCNNFGPFQHEEKLIPKVINNIINQKSIPIYGEGEQIREWIYAEDFGKAILKVLKHSNIGESYNIGSGKEFKNIDLTHLICDLMDQKLELNQSSKNLIAYVTDRPGHDFRYAMNSDKIKKHLNWKSETPFKEALDKTIDYYLNQNQSKKAAYL
ncbi:dTDP-glucose 4,6-dehydratase [Candidatus Pelagibacter ubique]|nr:dTDP-glucose 4,6-dehydratase [Candidatus Pelagibacter ubique]